MSYQGDFIKSISDGVMAASAQTGISSDLIFSQAALETGWGG